MDRTLFLLNPFSGSKAPIRGGKKRLSIKLACAQGFCPRNGNFLVENSLLCARKIFKKQGKSAKRSFLISQQ